MLPLPRYVTSFIITANSQKPAPALGRAGIGSLASASLRTVDAARDTRPRPPEVQLRAARRVRPSLLPFCDQGNCVTPTPESLRFSQHRDRPHNVAQHLIASSISTRATAPSSVCSSTRARFCAPPGADKESSLCRIDRRALLSPEIVGSGTTLSGSRREFIHPKRRIDTTSPYVIQRGTSHQQKPKQLPLSHSKHVLSSGFEAKLTRAW